MTGQGDRCLYVDQPRTEVKPFIPADTVRVLDVGCWRGGFGASLKADQPNRLVWGIEPDLEAAKVAAGRLDHVIVGSFPGDAPQGQLFTTITFIDVIEHFVDPWLALREARRLLSADGVVVAAIPNIRHIEALYPLVVHGRWDYRPAGLLDRTHLRFFTRATAVELFEATGYEVVRVAPVNVACGGRNMRSIARLGRWCEELVALHYVVVARPLRGSSDGDPGA